MPQYLIERNIAGLGQFDRKTLQEISAKSNGVVAELGQPYRWVTSYITGNKMYCVHEAESADAVFQHAKNGGFPADSVVEISALIGPQTANG